MKCGYCDNEMELGYIQSPRNIFWSKKRRKMFFINNQSQGDISITQESWNGGIKEAYHCKKCRKIIINT